MSNTDQASEPTMEEILSSIRKIIADDDPPDMGKASKQEPEPVVEEAAADADAEADTDADADADMDAWAEAEAEMEADAVPEPDDSTADASEDDIFELTDTIDEFDGDDDGKDEEDAPQDLMDPDQIDDLAFVESEEADPVPEPEPEPELVPEPVVEPEEKPEAVAEAAVSRSVYNAAEGLISDTASVAASSAFGRLAESMVLSNGEGRTIEDLVEDMLRPMLKIWLDENLPPLVERLVQEEIARVARRR